MELASAEGVEVFSAALMELVELASNAHVVVNDDPAGGLLVVSAAGRFRLTIERDK